MTEYTPRSSQDLNPFFANPQAAMSQYSPNSGVNYVYGNGQIHYTAVNTSYPPYSPTYLPTHALSPHCLPDSSHMALQYQQSSADLAQALSRQRLLSQPQYYSPQPMPQHPSRFSFSQDPFQMSEIEAQDSVNAATMLSEAVLPPLDGYPNVKEFDELMKCYVEDLSPKKQDKALIHARRAANIKTVLMDKKTTAVESAQFRFWVKKMFTLLPNDPKIPDKKKKICHEGKPVAIREKLFKILTRAHKQCQHGGRDKTSAQVRRIYSWVPKELISRFVKICPTCRVRRGSARTSPPDSVTSPTRVYTAPHSPDTSSPPESRRDSIMTDQSSISASSPLQTNAYSSQLQTQNNWLRSGQQMQGPAVMHQGSTNGLVPNSMGMISTTTRTSLGYPSTPLQSHGDEYRHSNFNATYLTNHGLVKQEQY